MNALLETPMVEDTLFGENTVAELGEEMESDDGYCLCFCGCKTRESRVMSSQVDSASLWAGK
jgi:hypothetical protein